MKVSILVEVELDVDKKTVAHWNATGEMQDAIRFSVARAEEKVQNILEKHCKRLKAVAGADYSSIE